MLDPFKVLEITENEIRAKYNCSITIDYDDYDEESLVDSVNQITLPGILDVFIPEKNDYTTVGLNYQVFLQKTLNIQESESFITIYYQPDDLIIRQDYIKVGMDMRFLIRLLHGQIRYINDPKIFLNVLHNTFQDADLVHLEVIISNMIRDKDDNSILGRYKTTDKNNTIVGVTKQASTDSHLSSMAFRHLPKAIERALIQQKEIKNNPIERILREDFS